MKQKNSSINKNKKKIRKKKKNQWKWILFVSIITLILAILFGFISERLLAQTGLLNAFIILIFIIFFGVFFDMIGIAVTAAKQTPFNSMAANKVYGAKQAVNLIKNAGQVSNFCNDVIGDICGIVSGSIGTIIIYRISINNNLIDTGMVGIILSGFIASLTVGGKAVGKNIALSKSNEIIYRLAMVVQWVKSFFIISKIK